MSWWVLTTYSSIQELENRKYRITKLFESTWRSRFFELQKSHVEEVL